MIPKIFYAETAGFFKIAPTAPILYYTLRIRVLKSPKRKIQRNVLIF